MSATTGTNCTLQEELKMDMMTALQQLAYYQPENYRVSLSTDEAHIGITNDGSFDARDLTDRTFQMRGLEIQIVANGGDMETPIETFVPVGEPAEDFDLERALRGLDSEWLFREVRVNNCDDLELIFLRNDARRIQREGIRTADLQVVEINQDCDTLFAIVTAADDRAWIICQNWTRADSRQITRIWAIQDSQKYCLYEKETENDDDDAVSAAFDWYVTYYNPPVV